MKKLLYASLLALAVLALVAPPAMAQEDKPFKVHGEVRFRGEYNSNVTDFDDNIQDNVDFWPYRVRVAVEGSFAKNVAAYVEFQNADFAGGNGVSFLNGDGGPFRTGSGNDGAFGNGSNVELYQGNITLNQLWSKNFSLRLGRQEIVAGNELLLGDLDFYSGISHDGAVGNWNLKKVNLMLWYTRPTQTGINAGVFGPGDNNYTGDNTGTESFWGGYATWTWKKDHSFDVYLMDLDEKQNFNVQTLGVRYAHDVMAKNGFFWNIEIAQQFGDADYASDSKAKGRAVEGWFGYNWRVKKNVHRLYGRYEMATGDDAGTNDTETFIPMFGDFHNRTGHGDWFFLVDLKAYSVGYNGFFNDRHEFGAAYWNYKAEQANGGDDNLGTAIDLWYGFNYSKNVSFTASLSQLNPGDGLTGGGGNPNDPVKRLYGQARLRF